MLGLTYVPGQVLLRTADVRSIGGWNEELRVVEDQDFLIRLGPGRRAAFTRRVMLYKRKHAAQHVGTPADKAAEDRLRRAHVASMRDSPLARTAHDLYRARVAYVSALDAYPSGRARAALVSLSRMVVACPALLVDRLVAPSFVRFSMKAVVRSLPGAERVWSAVRPLVPESRFHSGR